MRETHSVILSHCAPQLLSESKWFSISYIPSTHSPAGRLWWRKLGCCFLSGPSCPPQCKTWRQSLGGLALYLLIPTPQLKQNKENGEVTRWRQLRRVCVCTPCVYMDIYTVYDYDWFWRSKYHISIISFYRAGLNITLWQQTNMKLIHHRRTTVLSQFVCITDIKLNE